MSRNGDRKTTRTKPKSALVTAILLLLLVGVTVSVAAQEKRYFTPAEYSYPSEELPLNELVRRYGVTEAVEISFQLQQQEDDRREMGTPEQIPFLRILQNGDAGLSLPQCVMEARLHPLSPRAFV